jgi:hypothetical protein
VHTQPLIRTADHFAWFSHRNESVDGMSGHSQLDCVWKRLRLDPFAGVACRSRLFARLSLTHASWPLPPHIDARARSVDHIGLTQLMLRAADDLALVLASQSDRQNGMATHNSTVSGNGSGLIRSFAFRGACVRTERCLQTSRRFFVLAKTAGARNC